jgi:hypothetical protein
MIMSAQPLQIPLEHRAFAECRLTSLDIIGEQVPREHGVPHALEGVGERARDDDGAAVTTHGAREINIHASLL